MILKKLNIEIYIFFLSEEEAVLSSRGFFSQSFGYLNYQCCKLPGTGYRMGIPYRVYRMGIAYPVYHTVSYNKLRRDSTNVRQGYSFLFFIKAFISVYIFKYHQCNDFIFFPVFFYGFLENTDTFILA